MAFVSPLSIVSGSRFTTPQVCSLSSRRVAGPFSTRTVSPSSTQRQVPLMANAVTVYKDALLEKVLPLNFGRAVADIPREQTEIEELARQVEATNPSASTGTDPNLSAKWNMVYTTSTSILRIGFPKFLQPVEIIQYIDAANLKAKNEEVFQVGPFCFTNAVEARLTPRSAIGFDVKFIQFILFGFLKFNVEKNPAFSGFLDVTYLDEDVRISRGNKGNLFVLVKDKEADYP